MTPARTASAYPIIDSSRWGKRGLTFCTKDGDANSVAGREMLARFVEHVLPPRFVKIRHYGRQAASYAKTRFERA